jgi:hypothetical protein
VLVVVIDVALGWIPSVQRKQQLRYLKKRKEKD